MPSGNHGMFSLKRPRVAVRVLLVFLAPIPDAPVDADKLIQILVAATETAAVLQITALDTDDAHMPQGKSLSLWPVHSQGTVNTRLRGARSIHRA